VDQYGSVPWAPTTSSGTVAPSLGVWVPTALRGTKFSACRCSQDIKGKVKETVGQATGDEELERKGKTDQAKSAVRDVGEGIKDAASKVKDTVTHK
jgi:uncharacterized protein YjbJ (UPF0337 family)